ncbi:MAG: glucose 1-dehydrogenase [Rhodospirillales bacterium]|nr:glucose 1-dehydrogenase [Rhodospirillales bacterium]MCW8863111.1 glucose 1-dehydrogenase [Rhodospirillales bacterium]MCW8970194.1 glucose 1-dehydrogenase [Rhodospirillales bacterium]
MTNGQTGGRVAGKVALVTGASSGLGAACAERLANEGASVVLSDINVADGESLRDRIGQRALFVEHDVTNEDHWARVIDATIERFGRLDIVVNSAGIALLADIEHTSMEDWRKVLGVNLDGTFLGCKHGVKVMKETGGGSIINLSSVSGLVGGFNLAAYNASKGGVRLLTKSVALHCARAGYNIRCNSVHPTFIDTPMVQAMIDGSKDPERTRTSLIRQIPLGRLGTPEDVSSMVLYLASDESAFVTGSEMVVDGGSVAQ